MVSRVALSGSVQRTAGAAQLTLIVYLIYNGLGFLVAQQGIAVCEIVEMNRTAHCALRGCGGDVLGFRKGRIGARRRVA
jgi:hypothetical protein